MQAFPTYVYILFAKSAPRQVRTQKVCLVAENHEAFIFTCFAAAAQIASDWSWSQSTVSTFRPWANYSIWYYIAAYAYHSGQNRNSEPRSS